VTEQQPILPPAPVAVIGLGQMGLPMARRLLAAGFAMRGGDLAAPARDALAAAGGQAFARADQAAQGAAAVVTMLPNGRIVHDALLGDGGAAAALAPGALVIDMSSSAPAGTQALGELLAERGIALVDAPVSGGVRRAEDGSLAIMAGGPPALIERAMPLLLAMGAKVFQTGPLGSGHAMKALNNYVSAAGLLAAAEALRVGQAFGLAGETIVDVLNASSGRNNSTELKLKQFVLSGSFASGFSLALMAKDLRTAAELAAHLGIAAPGIGDSAALWERALAALGAGADHTEICRIAAVPQDR
jgi:3-hydroxyisobutyrate dehydrogenase